MTDLNEWISERRRIHDAAAEGPWWSTRDLQPATVFAGDGSADDLAVLTAFEHSDATAIVDAHNTLPAALTAIEKVLELHKATTHGECAICFECVNDDGYESDFSPVAYPCPTVRAIEGAINE